MESYEVVMLPYYISSLLSILRLRHYGFILN